MVVESAVTVSVDGRLSKVKGRRGGGTLLKGEVGWFVVVEGVGSGR